MIIDCISDLHGCKPALHGGDLLIIAGDLTARDTEWEHDDIFEWICDQSYIKKVFISGNHDNYIQRNNEKFLETLENSDIEYLCDSGTEFEGLKIWGSPWTSQFPGINPKCCAFTKPYMVRLQDRWELIPKDVNILITHNPPYGILDNVPREYNPSVGDKDLRYVLETSDNLKLHVFGHIHENGGQQIILKRPGYGDENNVICVNASVVDGNYRQVNKPIRIIL